MMDRFDCVAAARWWAAWLVPVFLLAACGPVAPATNSAATSVNNTITVTITDGYDTDLGVPPEVFREAFSHVKPASVGQAPDPAQVKLNKTALLDVLGPYGVTNDALDRVSNYYRFNGSAGETWPRTPATATALTTNGVLSGFVITNPGSGYSSTPAISITGAGNATAVATIAFGTDFNTNGSLTAITLVQP